MTKARLSSLDVFRGFTIMMMTIVNNPGSWAAIYPPLEHAEWNGCTPTDIIFPSFIFIMGTAIPFAIHKKFDAVILNKIMVRSLRLFCLGLFLNFFNSIEFFGFIGIPLLTEKLIITFAVAYALLGKFTLKIKTFLAFSILSILLFLAYSGIPAFKEVRIPGVLQRIAIVYFCTSILFLKSTMKTQILVVSTLLLGYWALMTLVPVPGIGEANLEKGTNLAAYIDNLFLKNHMYSQSKTWDPEGILITLPAIASGIIGMLIGELLNRSLPKIEIVKKMTVIGLGLVILGLIWNIKFPINKSIWSSSFVLFTSGLSTISFCMLYYIIEIANYKKWTKLFLIWGVNPMIVFFFSGIIPRVLTMTKVDHPALPGEPLGFQSYFYNYGIVPYFENPKDASLAYALIYAIFWSILLWKFYKNKLFFKV
jgi:predicted acyltransferase